MDIPVTEIQNRKGNALLYNAGLVRWWQAGETKQWNLFQKVPETIRIVLLFLKRVLQASQPTARQVWTFEKVSSLNLQTSGAWPEVLFYKLNAALLYIPPDAAGDVFGSTSVLRIGLHLLEGSGRIVVI